jgi:hypothetical protein
MLPPLPTVTVCRELEELDVAVAGEVLLLVVIFAYGVIKLTRDGFKSFIWRR